MYFPKAHFALLSFIVVVLGTFICSVIAHPSDTALRTDSSDDLDHIIKELYHKIKAEQWTESHKYRVFPPRWATQRGLFRSFIHVNVVGNNKVDDIIRNDFRIPDMNMFVTSFVITALAEAEQLGTIEPDEQMFSAALDAVSTFRDKNRGPDTAAYCFWPQSPVDYNGKTLYTARPVNLVEPMKYFDSLTHFVEHILKFLGLENIEERIEAIASSLDSMAAAFHIPADSDDSAVNLVLGAVLRQTSKRVQSNKRSIMYHQLFNRWTQVNPNPTSAFNLLDKYAYRPLVPEHKSIDVNHTNVIDPRTYYFLSEFLGNLNSSSRGEPRVVTTWLEHIEEDYKTTPIVAMPFQVNNVDLTVCVNTLYGIAHTFLYQEDRTQWFTPKLQELLETTANVVAWGISTDSVFSRPDLGLLYYPSIYDFYWLASRVLFLLDNEDFAQHQFPVFERVQNVLETALRTHGTKQLLDSVLVDGDQKFWDDFLGDFGGKKRGDDRLFSTALGVNALVDIWTFQREHGRCWIPETPSSVRTTVNAAVRFLKKNLLSGRYRPDNAFFSGSVKTGTTMPFSYPGNYAADLKVTTKSTFDPRKDELPHKDLNFLSYGMAGTVSNSQYKNMIKDTYWKVFKVPAKFEGFNDPDSPFPFWSSPVMTWSMSLLALSKYSVLGTTC